MQPIPNLPFVGKRAQLKDLGSFQSGRQKHFGCSEEGTASPQLSVSLQAERPVWQPAGGLPTLFRGNIQPCSVKFTALSLYRGSAHKIIDCPRPSLEDIADTRCLSRVKRATNDSSQASGHHLFDLLPPRRQYGSMYTSTNRLLNRASVDMHSLQRLRSLF